MTSTLMRACWLTLLVATFAGAARAQTLGASCQDDADCAEGLFCLGEGEGDTVAVSGGLCTTTCSAHSQDCVAFDPGAACVGLQLSEGRRDYYCLQGCDPGPGDKCHGRGDVACDRLGLSTGTDTTIVTDVSCEMLNDSPVECVGAAPEGRSALCSCELDLTDSEIDPAGLPFLGGAVVPCAAPGFCEYATTVCVPRCTTDEGCPEGLGCNPATGLCDTRGRVGAPPGGSCAAGCAGTCGAPLAPPDPGAESELRCTEGCVIGEPCGPPSVDSGRCFSTAIIGTTTPVGNADGRVVGVSSFGSPLGPGDLAECQILCACQADCGALGDDWVCERVEKRAYALRGYRGRCVQGGAINLVTDAECPTASADCTPGTTRPCRGPDDCLGEAACLPDGTYAPCDCSGASARDASTADPGLRDAGLLDGGAAPVGASIRGGGCAVLGSGRSPSPLALASIYGVLVLLRARRRSRPPRRKTSARP